MTDHCYDTEFLENGSTIELISIGIVADDGREYYAVNADMNQHRIRNDEWLLANVWPHLPTRPSNYAPRHTHVLDTTAACVKPKWVIANEVRDFIIEPDPGGAVKPNLWAYYAAYDHVALCQLWGKMVDLPMDIPMWTNDLKQLIEPLGETWPKPPHTGNEHNALDDALWNQKLLRAARRALEPPAEPPF